MCTCRWCTAWRMFSVVTSPTCRMYLSNSLFTCTQWLYSLPSHEKKFCIMYTVTRNTEQKQGFLGLEILSGDRVQVIDV